MRSIILNLWLLKFFNKIFISYKPNVRILAYISTTFAYALMHNVFNFYYVKMFLNYYYVSPSWFQFSQIVFMVWNTVNDPLFGYCQDNSKWGIFKSRRLSILFGAPLFGLSFLVPWIPFGNYQAETPPWIIGIHLLCALCLYDTMFTFVLLAHCSLFAEMNIDYKERLNMKWWSVIAHLCAGVSVPLVNHTSRNFACLSCFRLTCIGIAVISSICMIFTGLKGRTIYEEKCPQHIEKTSSGSIWKITMEILSIKDFHGFVWLNFLHQGHSVFQSNFSAIFIDFLAPGLSVQFLNLYFTLLSTLPAIISIIFRGIVESLGYYRVIRVSCFIKIFTSFSIWIFGQKSYVFLVYLLLDNVLIHAISNLYDIVLSDLIDKDKHVYGRKQPISSMIFATNALITKPAISIFPMMVVAILTYNGYSGAIKNLNLVSADHIYDSRISDVMFNLACGVPFIVGILQLISWTYFTIRSSHISSIHPINSDIV